MKTLVWDVPVRVFHWLLVACFAGAWLTAESERWRQVHVTLGYSMAGLVAFRVVWGTIGTPFARFVSFVRGHGVVIAYLRSLVTRKPKHYIGHNPVGALAIVGLLTLIALVAGSGWAAINNMGGNVMEKLHDAGAHALLVLVVVHVVGVVVSSVLHRENLVRSMFTGRKLAPPDAEDAARISAKPPRAWAILGAALFAAVLGFWVWTWQNPTVPVEEPAISGTRHADEHR